MTRRIPRFSTKSTPASAATPPTPSAPCSKACRSASQALCVTHLAQVAVCADQQIQVQKTSEGSLTRVETNLLGKTERIDEIARMLGGRLSDQSRAHASELLATAATRH